MLTINHHELDRIPCVYKGTPEVDEMIVKHFGLTDIEEIKRIFNVENLHFPFKRIPAYPDGLYFKKRLPGGLTEDIWGVKRKEISYGLGVYEEIVFSPLSSARTVAEIKEYKWPKVEDFNFSGLFEECLKFKDYALSGVEWNIFELAWALRGFQQFLMDMVIDEKLAWAIIKEIQDFYFQYNERLMKETKGLLDILFSADDFGMQTGLIISKKLWKKYFARGMKKIYSWAKKNNLKTFLHSDGAIREIIPDLIDIGLDVLDPIQVQAKGMNPYELKNEFGQSLCFHGTIDVQKLLPFSKVQKVKDEVKRHIELLAPGGGFFLAPSHCIQLGVPIENIIAIYEVAGAIIA